MVIVISCSGSKTGDLLQYDGQSIAFCADSSIAPQNNKRYVHPDEINNDQTWREWINDNQSDKNLTEAYRLYKPSIYRELQLIHKAKLYIFSAGWGIVQSSFKLPVYDITFSKLDKKENYKVRKPEDPSFLDYNHLEEVNSEDDILFTGGSAYILPFCHLTKHLKNKKIIIYKSRLNNEIEQFIGKRNFVFEEYSGIKRGYTNWHYTYAKNELLKK